MKKKVGPHSQKAVATESGCGGEFKALRGRAGSWRLGAGPGRAAILRKVGDEGGQEEVEEEVNTGRKRNQWRRVRRLACRRRTRWRWLWRSGGVWW